MKKNRLTALSLIFILILMTASVKVFHPYATASSTWHGYVMPSFVDYAPSGMPDFDERQDAWNPTGAFTWCGPTVAADILWWLDSEYESIVFPNPVPPPTISDHFPLVHSFGTNFDDHDPRNVAALIPLLAGLMDTDGLAWKDAHVGTRFADFVNGTQFYINMTGLSRIFQVDNVGFPTLSWIDSEAQSYQGVALFLDFEQWNGFTWTNSALHTDSLKGGHYIAVAGVNTTINEVLISDPLNDAYQSGTDSLGREPVVPPGPTDYTTHNDTQYVSQDGYSVTTWLPPPPLPGSPYAVPVLELVNYLQTLDPSYGPNWHTFIIGAVAVSPTPVTEWPGYIKPSYPDYAPSGMPDFDEKQPAWSTNGVTFTWCVPVAVADTLWWLDSKYESILDPNPVAPPTISDHFNLVNSSNPTQWDDHSPSNLDSLVRTLALLMNTDGLNSGGDHSGTRYTDIQPGIQAYLKQQGVSSMFEVHNQSFPDFPWIDNETEECQGVELCLEFWHVDPSTGLWTNYTSNEDLNNGHCVACAGANATADQILISDPYLDAYEAGNAPGRSPVPEAYPHNAAAHNDTRYVSQDAYNVVPFVFPPGPPSSPPGYPSTAWLLEGYAQAAGLDKSWYAFIRGSFATSPVAVHDVAITNVTSPKKVICQTLTGNVTTSVANLGNLPETVNVTVYANLTSVLNATKIGSFTNVPVGATNNVNLTLVWNTTGFAKGNYTLVAYADPVPGETNTTNNNYADSNLVAVSMLGDLTGATSFVPDGKCDGRDITLVARCFGSNVGDARYDPNCDLLNRGKIDGRDITIVARDFGKHDP
jgi:hypothetical protein